MQHSFPEQWTETDLSYLSGEDDRYEFKSGRIVFDREGNNFRPDDQLKNELATEICAFANSFGGTLFLGVLDNNSGIDGIPKYYKNNARNPIKEWLDKTVTHLLDFRLPDYRVSYVRLGEDTAKKLGDERVVIAIDVPDSNLAPHQNHFDQKYYYRNSSNSNPAPHHYVAYLFSRSSQQMSEVVNRWCSGFLNELINEFTRTEDTLRYRAMDRDSVAQMYGYESLCDNLIADQFLRTFPAIKERCDDFVKQLDEINKVGLAALIKLIADSAGFDNVIRSLYIETIAGDVTDVDSKETNAVLIDFCGNAGLKTINTLLIKSQIAGGIAAQLLGGVYSGLTFQTRDKIEFWDKYGQRLADSVSFDKTIQLKTQEIDEMLTQLHLDSIALLEFLTKFRYDLCLRHSTYY